MGNEIRINGDYPGTVNSDTQGISFYADVDPGITFPREDASIRNRFALYPPAFRIFIHVSGKGGFKEIIKSLIALTPLPAQYRIGILSFPFNAFLIVLMRHQQ